MNEVLAQERTVGISKLATGQLGQQRVTYQPQRHSVQAEKTSLSTGHKLLSGLADLAQGLAQQGFKNSLEDAYRRGETQRQLGYTEDQLESNWLTRPFTKGGWRDRNYLLVTAEWEQNARNWISQNAHLNPDEMAAELQTQMRQLDKHLPTSSMSAKGRQDSTAHLMRAQESLMQFYTEQHQAYSSKHGSQNVNAAMQGILSGVASEYDYANGLADPTVPLERLYTVMTDGIDNLAPELQSSLRKLAIQSMYEDGHVTLADHLTTAFNVDNSNTLMTLEERIELGKHREKARKKAQWVHQGEATALIANLDNLVKDRGALSTDEIGRIMSRLYELQYQPSPEQMKRWFLNTTPTSTSKMNAAMDDYINKRINETRTHGFTTDAIGDAVFTEMLLAAGDDTYEAYKRMVDYQADFGHIAPKFKNLVQESMTAMISAAGADAEGDPRHVQVVQATLDGIRQLDAGKAATAKFNILAGMDENTRAIFAHVLDNPNLPAEHTLGNAIARVTKAAQEEMRDAAAPQRRARLLEDVMKHAEKHGSGFWQGVKGITGMGEAGLRRNAQAKANFDAAVIEKAREIARNSPNVNQPAEVIFQQAVHDVEERLYTWHGDRTWSNLGLTGTQAVLLPEGFAKDVSEVRDPNTGRFYLGGNTASRTHIGKALETVVGDIPSGSEVFYDTSDRGDIDIFFRPVGATTQDYELYKTITPEVLAQEIHKNQTEDQQKKVGSAFGAAHTVVDPTVQGRSMQMLVSGQNSAGLPEGDVYDWKQQLMQRESFRWRAYPDGKDPDGTQRYSVGFGHRLPAGTSIVQHPTERQLEQWFKEDTDNAISAAHRLARQYGFDDDPQAVLAVAAMVYQMGEGGAAGFKNTLQQIADGTDYDGLVERSKSWKWYTGDGDTPGTPERVQDFLERLKPRFTK